MHHAKNLHVWFYTLQTVYNILTFSARFILKVFLTNPGTQLTLSVAFTLQGYRRSTVFKLYANNWHVIIYRYSVF